MNKIAVAKELVAVAKELQAGYETGGPYSALEDGLDKADREVKALSSKMSRWRQYHKWNPKTYSAISAIIDSLCAVADAMDELRIEAASISDEEGRQH